MAAEDEGRTEEPSEYKLEKARKEGRVAKSQDVSSALVLVLTVLTLVFLGKWILSQCAQILRYYFLRTATHDVTDPNLAAAFFAVFIRVILPTMVVSVVAGIVGNIIQTRGFVVSLKPITPDFKRIMPKPGEYFKKTIFSAKGLFNIAKSIGKVAIVIAIAFFIIRRDIYVLMDIISNGNISMAIGKIAGMAARLLIIISVLFLVLSIPDFFVQRHEFRESMKMTKQEVKEEYKEMEGDPEVKGRLRQMQQQLLSQNLPKAVAESDVVITNPTHFAVALRYERERSEAPKVNAKGADEMAMTIRRLARENGIPIVENRPVARGLYTDTELGDIIPEAYFRVVSVIYAKLGNLKK